MVRHPRAFLLSLVLLSMALLCAVGGCAEQRAPEPTPGPTEAVSTAAVPQDMSKYAFDAAHLQVTFTAAKDGDARQALVAVTDALADLPVTFAATTDDARRPQLNVTWSAPATPDELSAAKTAVSKAAPESVVTSDTVHLVAVKFSTTLASVPPATLPATLSREMSGRLPGRYTVTVNGNSVTAIWAAPGLTGTGRDRLRDAFAAALDVPTTQVDVATVQ